MKIKLSEKSLRSLAETINEVLNEQVVVQGIRTTLAEKDKEIVVSVYHESFDLDEVIFSNENQPRFVLDIEEYTIINEHGTTGTTTSLPTRGRGEIRSSAFDGKNRCTQQ